MNIIKIFRIIFTYKNKNKINNIFQKELNLQNLNKYLIKNNSIIQIILLKT